MRKGSKLERFSKYLDKTGRILRATIEWISRSRQPPIAYIAEDRTRVATGRSALLEFGLHSRGSETEVRVGENRLISVPGTLLIMNAHYGNYGTPVDSWRFWCLSFDVGQSAPLPDIGAAPLLSSALVRDPAAMVQRYENLAREIARPGPCRPERVKGSVLLLLGDLLESLPDTEGESLRFSPAVQAAMEWMQRRHHDADLDLESIARHVHVSAAHFGRLFRLETGMAPMKYLRDIRLARSRELLLRTRLTVGEISREVGYRDPAYFSRLFKSRMEVSPRGFRRNQADHARR